MGSPLQEEALSVLRDLLRIDTTNPPGNEVAAAEYLAEKFRAENIDAEVVESAPGRGNVIARLRGGDEAPPLLLSAHLDVVPADESEWTHPPFAAEIADGYLWGRGACDMKYAAAQSFAVMAELAREQTALKRDIIFAGVADEEQGGRMGAGFLVDEHAEKIKAEFCLNELGGMVTTIGDTRAVMVQTAHRGFEWVRVKVTGRPGHGTLPNPQNPIHLLAAALEKLRGNRLGYHLCGSADAFLRAAAQVQGGVAAAASGLLRSAATAPLAIRLAPENRRSLLEAALYNTAIPTSVSAGDPGVPNTIQQTASAVVDGRYLPGISREQFLVRLQSVLGDHIELEPFRGLPPYEAPRQSEMMSAIEAIAKERGPDATVVPLFMPGFTDAPHYARAGITTYGFVPIVLKKDEPFAELYHAPDERISVEGFGEGVEWYRDLIRRFCARGADGY